MTNDIFTHFITLEPLRQFHKIARNLFGFTLGVASPATNEMHYFGSKKKLNPFCLTLQKDYQAYKHCAACDKAHQAQVRLSQEPLAYTCHAGLTDFVIPVTVNQQLVAFLICGQVLDKKPTETAWKKVEKTLSHYKLPMKEMRRYYFATRVLEPQWRDGLLALFGLFGSYMADAGYKLMLFNRGRNSGTHYLAVEYLKAHAYEPFQLQAVADAAYTSKRTLTRLFKQETGRTLVEYLHQLRIERALELLASPGNKIAKVAYESGFESVQQFNRVFKKLKKCTPRDWQKMRR